MFRHRVTSLAVLMVLSLFVQNVNAHIKNPNINARASVYVLANPGSDVETLVAEAGCSFSIGAHANADDFHLHKANWFGQVYIIDPGGHPTPGPFYAVKNPTGSIWGNGSWTPNSSPITVSKTL